LFTGRNSSNVVHVDGFTTSEGTGWQAWFDTVGPDYFSTIRAAFSAGRGFTERDNAPAPHVAVVSQSFPKHFFGARNPIGNYVYVGVEKKPWQVVGVVRGIRTEGVRAEPRRYIYLPAAQAGPLWSLRFLMRTAGPPESMFDSFRRVVREEDSRLPVISVHAAEQLLNRTMDRDRLMAHLAAAFGFLSLLIAAVGTYGLLSYEVAKRTHELGIRMALGARRAAIVRMVLSEIGVVCLAGIAIGTAAALMCGRFVQTLLFGLEPDHPAVLTGAAAVLLVTALAAAGVPALRAVSIDPMAALRHE
jgi:predicted permease